MARAATTADAFNAVAEPRRRDILDALARASGPSANSWTPGPGASRTCHGTCGCCGRWAPWTSAIDGRQRLYRLKPQALKPIHDWVASYQHLWEERFELLDDVLEDLKEQEKHGEGARQWHRQAAEPWT